MQRCTGFNAGGTADSDDDIRPGIIEVYSGTVFFFYKDAVRPAGEKRRYKYMDYVTGVKNHRRWRLASFWQRQNKEGKSW